MPKRRKTQLLTARLALAGIIERYAVEHDLLFTQAALIIVQQDEHFELMLLATGNRYTGKTPTAKTLRRWKDKRKVAVAKQYPRLSSDQLEWVAAYLPPSKRQLPKPDLKAQALTLLPQMGRKALAEQLGVSLATIYRWYPSK